MISFLKNFSTLILCAMLLACQQPPAADIHLSGNTMGTTYNVKYPAQDDVVPGDLQALIDARLATINELMSTYDPGSELSRFNRTESTEAVTLAPETVTVLNEAVRLGELSQGALDVTVGPLVNLWGFGPDNRPDTVPSDEQIAAARQRTGLDKLSIDGNEVAKGHPQLYVDLSTIAKGYAVDSVAELLEAHGLANYLVEIGGEMRVRGQKGSGQDWRIAIEKPVSTERSVQRIITIGNNAIATSGDYRNYFEDNGVRYSHLIDPLTGKPIQHKLVAVTVVHPRAMTADGLATALIVMGKDKALSLAAQNNLAVMLITRENGEFKEYTSERFLSIVSVIQ